MSTAVASLRRCLALSLATLLAAAAWSAAAPQERIRLVPRFETGQTLRYQMEFRTTTEGSTESPVADPQAAGVLEVSVSATVRFDVLSASGTAARLRATYESLASTTRGDLADPRAAESDREFASLEGRTLVFEIDATGRVSGVTGIDDVFPEQQEAVREWLSQLSITIQHPSRGIAPGDRWSAEDPRTMTVPLRGVSWRTESAYLRNEPCRIPVDPNAAAAEESCAVILTRLEVVERGSRRDPTPDEYRRLGLRTAGSVTGSGESLSYVSLATGLVVSVTQTGAEEIDLTISSEDGESRVRYRGRIRSHSQITLLPAASGTASPPAL
jgi:hypothetical protein